MMRVLLLSLMLQLHGGLGIAQEQPPVTIDGLSSRNHSIGPRLLSPALENLGNRASKSAERMPLHAFMIFIFLLHHHSIFAITGGRRAGAEP